MANSLKAYLMGRELMEIREGYDWEEMKPF